MGKIKKKVYNWFKKKDMPPRILTIEEINASLTQIGGTWMEFPGTAILPSVTINGPQNISVVPNRGYVIKVFINSENGELKTFLAKSINIPGRENL